MALNKPDARFVLVRDMRKGTCPRCGHHKVFRRYVDTITGELLPEHLGACDRADNCNYSFTAKEWLLRGGLPSDIGDLPPLPPPKPKDTSYRMPESDASYFLDHTSNGLAEYLSGFFGRDEVIAAFERYGVGTYVGRIEKLHGATIFWQRDINGSIRTGEVMVYEDGHRSKKEGHHTWAHYLKKPLTASEQGVSECFFGEHLVPRWKSWIGIVESAKTAIICSIAYPDILWLSCRAMQGLTLDKFTALVGRDVILFPDAGKGHQDWTERAGIIEPCLNTLIVSDVVEAYGCMKGEDIADLIIPLNILGRDEVELVPRTSEPKTIEPVKAEIKPMAEHPPVVQRMIDLNPAVGVLIDLLELDTKNAIIQTK